VLPPATVARLRADRRDYWDEPPAGEVDTRLTEVDEALIAQLGRDGLCGEVALADDDALYDFLTGTVGRIAGLRDTDVTMQLRTLKRAAIAA
jgi:hypothetical protein